MSFKEDYQQALNFEGHYTVAGKEVVCSHCGGTTFDDRVALLNTRGMTFLRLDWLNAGAYLLVCKKCSHIEWFLEAPKESS